MKYHIKVTRRTNQALKTKMEEACMTVVDLGYKVGVDKAIISKILHRKLTPSKVTRFLAEFTLSRQTGFLAEFILNRVIRFLTSFGMTGEGPE